MEVAMVRSWVKRIVRDERGGEAIDYVLVMGLIVIGTLLLMGPIGIKLAERWRAILNTLEWS